MCNALNACCPTPSGEAFILPFYFFTTSPDKHTLSHHHWSKFQAVVALLLTLP